MKKILIIDDDNNIILLLSSALRKIGYQISAAQDGLTAISAVRSFQPDLVILDIGLPCGDGLSVLKRIKQSYQTNSIPVIILTGSTDEKHKTEVERMGAEAYLTKPFQTETVLAEIGRILSHSA